MIKTEGIPPTEFSEKFINGMLTRMAVSYHKYGSVAATNKLDMVASLEKRLALYKQTGNTEWLIDVANLAMIEFMQPKHPNAHFRATDSDESPGRVTLEGHETDLSNRELNRRHDD